MNWHSLAAFAAIHGGALFAAWVIIATTGPNLGKIIAALRGFEHNGE